MLRISYVTVRSFLRNVPGTLAPADIRHFTLEPKSYVSCPGKQPLMYKTFGNIIDEAAEKFGDRIMFVSARQNQRVTFAEAKKKADQFAAGLLAMGVKPGDRVGIWGPNSMEWYIANMALAKGGFVSVYINPAYQATEVMHSLRKVGVKMLIMAETFKSQNYYKILEEIVPDLSRSQPGKFKSDELPDMEFLTVISETQYPGAFKYNEIFEKGTESSKSELEKIAKDIEPEDPCNIQFTSGTTGSPKGATLSHFSIVNNSHLIGLRLELQQKEHRMCLLGPFFHAMGSVIAIMNCVHHGISLVVADHGFNPEKSISVIQEEKCTILMGTPTMYVDLISIVKEKGVKFSSTELCVTGGALCTPELYKDMIEVLGAKRAASVYGLTESGPVAFISNPTDGWKLVTSTVGSLMEHTEAKVVDEKGATLPRNTPGELWLRGFLVMSGYWNDDAKTKDAITSDFWLKTGDQFMIDENGYGKIVGRIKDLIIRGGENIYPLDIEEYLSTHSAILESQVVGIPDERLGEQVCACIILKQGAKLTADELKQYCKGKIAHFKIPFYVCFFEEFPKTASGKIQRFKLREQVIKMLEDEGKLKKK